MTHYRRIGRHTTDTSADTLPTHRPTHYRQKGRKKSQYFRWYRRLLWMWSKELHTTDASADTLPTKGKKKIAIPKKRCFLDYLTSCSHSRKKYILKGLVILRRIKDEIDCPSYMTELLTKNADRHNRTSRYEKYNLVYAHRTTEKLKGRESVSGAKLWNSIPFDIRKKDSIGSFKCTVKKYFLTKNS